jgi:predicted O-methyltransferase YrrM
MAAANKEATVYTIEGSPAIQQRAATNFVELQLPYVKSLTGSFDAVLPQVLNAVDHVDLAYVDGNHRLQPTLHYFGQLLRKRTPESILIFDDIHWSKEMEEAWRVIQQHPGVTCSIDLFFLGFVFFRPQFKAKQHFCIRF